MSHLSDASEELPVFIPQRAMHREITTEADRLKIVIAGHVDHGKSTLIGRLFHDTDSLPLGKVESIRQACAAEGMEFEYAFLLDALLEEQAQNITIDTTQIQFHTARRNYVIIDAPGHKEFLKNMITGAASADAAILLVDAAEGVQDQSRRHGFLLSLLGIRQVVVAVNKMDLVNYSREKFEEVCAAFSQFLEPLGIRPLHYIPISARHGHNITNPSQEMAWYSGPTALAALDGITPPPPREQQPLRFCLQDIYRFDERRILAGRIETGSLTVGDELVFWPDRRRSRIRSIEAWGHPETVTSASAGQSVAITLHEQIFAERGQTATHPGHGMAEVREFEAKLFWLHHDPLPRDVPFNLRIGTQEVEARIVDIQRVIDSSTLDLVGEHRPDIRRHEVAEVRLRARRPIACDTAERFPETGRFVIMWNGRIGGGGIVTNAAYSTEPSRAIKSSDLTWTTGAVNRESRAELLGHTGAVLWLTGLSGSGKSTLAVAAESVLHRRGILTFILDGDNLRHGLCGDLGFSPEDRAENIRRAGETARLLAESGVVVLTSLISPFRAERERVRGICRSAGIPFAEIYVNAPIAVCEQRDPRGLYKKARSGELRGFTGIDSPYEAPTSPDLELHTDRVALEECVAMIFDRALQLSHPSQLYRAEENNPDAVI